MRPTIPKVVLLALTLAACGLPDASGDAATGNGESSGGGGTSSGGSSSGTSSGGTSSGAASSGATSSGGTSSGAASSGGTSSGGTSSGAASSSGTSSGGTSSGAASSGGSSSGATSSGGTSSGGCPSPVPGTRVSIDAGGAAAGDFLADAYFAGGSTFATPGPIDLSGIPCEPPPASVFQSERYGEFTYTIAGRTPGTPQAVTLYFEESFWTAAGQRTFDVSLNGATALRAFDIFAEAGGANRAIARTLTTTADASGQVVLRFSRNGPDQPKVCGFTVAGEGGPPPAPLGATPPMGWNSWNTFQCSLDEALVKATADAMVSSGMKDAGYRYVNLDDCWMDGRDASGKLRWNASKFPSGIPALAAYVHDKGLKLGIYETPATLTCAGRYGGMPASAGVGSLGHEAVDARTFAEWGVDYLKYDLCLGDRSGFAVMRDALRATGRPIVYSINPGNGQGDLCPPDRCTLDLPSLANLWRIGFDIDRGWESWMRLLDENAGLSAFAGPGHFNDPDMLEVGNGRSETEDRAHFSLWAIMAAPLIAGNDLRSMSSATRAILTNAEVIAVDQDPLGAQGRVVATPGPGLQVWSKPLADGARAVVLFNRNGTPAWISASWSALGIPAGPAAVRDLWSHADLGTSVDSYTAPSVPGHGVVMLRIVR